MKKDNYIFLFCILLVGAFILLLPYMSKVVIHFNHFKEKNGVVPNYYRCKMSWNYEENGYVLNQDATYTIEDSKILKAEIHREYFFQEEAKGLQFCHV